MARFDHRDRIATFLEELAHLLPCIRRELLKFKLTNQNSASGKNCAILVLFDVTPIVYIRAFSCDSLDRRFFELIGTEMMHCSGNQFANPVYELV